MFEHFDVEFCDKNGDVIYHFWPPKDGNKFRDRFGYFLQEGFKRTLPSWADVRAEYTNLIEATLQGSHMQICPDKESRTKNGVPWIPRETYFVRVVDGVRYPFADKYLKHRVFENIEAAIRETKP